MKQIKDQTQLFRYIDSGFEKWNVVEDKQVEKRELNIFELKEDKNSTQIFDKPEEQWVTQEELIDFCENRKDELQDNESSNLFLLKSSDKFFVVVVEFIGADRLGVYVYGLSYDAVWHASSRHRFVLPATKPVILNSTETLKTSDPEMSTEKALNYLLEQGYKVTLGK